MFKKLQVFSSCGFTSGCLLPVNDYSRIYFHKFNAFWVKIGQIFASNELKQPLIHWSVHDDEVRPKIVQ